MDRAAVDVDQNNLDSAKAIFDHNKDEIAIAILEPIAGNSGFV